MPLQASHFNSLMAPFRISLLDHDTHADRPFATAMCQCVGVTLVLSEAARNAADSRCCCSSGPISGAAPARDASNWVADMAFP